MPLIQIRRDPEKITASIMVDIIQDLPVIAARSLSSPEGGVLKPVDMMIEADDFKAFDTNNKHIHVRVIAHDYPSRRADLNRIRKEIAAELLRHLPDGISWYVWVLLAPTSYGSDTEP